MVEKFHPIAYWPVLRSGPVCGAEFRSATPGDAYTALTELFQFLFPVLCGDLSISAQIPQSDHSTVMVMIALEGGSIARTMRVALLLTVELAEFVAMHRNRSPFIPPVVPLTVSVTVAVPL